MAKKLIQFEEGESTDQDFLIFVNPDGAEGRQTKGEMLGGFASDMTNIAAQVAADKVVSGENRAASEEAAEQTSEDRVATGEDRTAVAEDKITVAADRELADASADIAVDGANRAEAASGAVISLTPAQLHQQWAREWVESPVGSNFVRDTFGNIVSATVTWQDGLSGTLSNVVVGSDGITSLRVNRPVNENRYILFTITYASGDVNSMSTTPINY